MSTLSSYPLRLICLLLITRCWNRKLPNKLALLQFLQVDYLANPTVSPREHCNCIVLRSGKQLKGPKGARADEDGEKNHDESNNALPSEDEP